MGFKQLLPWLLIAPLFVSGCLGLAIYDDDNLGVVTGKVIARTLLAIPTLGYSETSLSKQKEAIDNSAFIITNGSHSPVADPAPSGSARKPVVVWGNNPGAVTTATVLVQQRGELVVERSKISHVLDEQKFRLTYSPESAADILKVGQLVGASAIIFIEVETHVRNEGGDIIAPPAFIPGSAPLAPPEAGRSYSRTTYDVSVSARSVKVDNGIVNWSGTATTNKPVTNPELTIEYLTQGAMLRALCPTENDYRKDFVWIEQGPWRKHVGCLKHSQ